MGHGALVVSVGICPLCRGGAQDVLSEKLRRGQGVVFYCQHCEVGFLVAESRDDRAHYAGPYREKASHLAEGGPTNPKEIFETYSRYQGDRLKLVGPFLNSDASVLEVGASAGQFLVHLEHRCARRCAIELDPACCAQMETMGIEVDSHVLRESKFSQERFDLVVAFQTMEHVEDPVGFLEDIRSVMSRGGVAVIEVPNLRDALLSAWQVPEYRAFYYHADHRFYFTEYSLREIARRVGFVNPKIHYSQDYNLLSTINWLMNKVPQPTCHPGLSRIKFEGADPALSRWLTSRMSLLSDEYADLLAKSGTSSNITMILT